MNKLSINLNEIKNLDNFSGVVPVFPLSTIVFFPNTLLPLHIFEQRYREMVEDTLKSEKIIAMALLKPGWENDYYGKPEIFKIAGMGRIVSSETFENGKSNLVLYGLKRIEILEEIENEKPYRTAKIKILENEKSGDSDSLREQMKYLVSSWNGMLGETESKHMIHVNLKLPIEHLTDVMASLLITNVFERQKILEETDVEKRAEILISFFKTRLKVFSITGRRKRFIKETRNLN